MNQETVESMVTHLVQCSCNGFVDYPKRNEKVEGKVVPFKQISYKEKDQSCTPMKWNTIFKDLFSRCPQLCRDELVLPKPVSTVRWRERNSREVLAPLGLKQNSANIMAGSLDMSRKRKAETSIWIPTKRAKVDDESAKPCNVLIKKAPLKILLLEYKCMNTKSFVKLFDVIKEIPQVKEEVKPIVQNEFMNFLGLATQASPFNKPHSEVKTSHPTKLLSHPQIPFSSDYGQRLITRERHYLPQEVALRKIERTEWYLKGTSALGIKNNLFPDIPYDDRKLKYLHKFNFPKRQYHQNHLSLEQAFIKYICKPVAIQLEKIDLRWFLEKTKQEVVIINNESNETGGILTPNHLPEESNEVLSIDSKKLSDNCGGDTNLQLLQCDLTSGTRSRLKLISKPRRSRRLNNRKL